MIGFAKKTLSVAMLVMPAAVFASDFPTQPIKIVVPYSAGGSTDTAARVLADGMAKQFSQPVIVENKPGAGGTIGTMAVKNAPADGYTLLITSASHIVNKMLQPELQYDIEEDFVPLSQITQLPIVMVVRQDHPVKSAKELVKTAQSNPDKLTFGTAGVGTIQHSSALQMLNLAKINAVHVPYKGGAAAVTDVIGGQIDFTFAPLVEVLGYIQSNRLRALAITTTERSAVLPDVPSLSEIVPGYETFHWNGFVVRRGTPPEAVKKLSDALVAATKDATVIDRLKAQGTQAKGNGPDALAALMKNEKNRLGPLLKGQKTGG